jgi:hypothetical protein
MKSGYAYQFTGAGPWKASKGDEAWDVVVVSSVNPTTGRKRSYGDARGATFVGFRTIDGTRCTVWSVARKGVAPVIYAQSEAHTPARKGLR